MNTLFSDGCNISVCGGAWACGSGEITPAEGLHDFGHSKVQPGHVQDIRGAVGEVQMGGGHAASNQPENNFIRAFWWLPFRLGSRIFQVGVKNISDTEFKKKWNISIKCFKWNYSKMIYLKYKENLCERLYHREWYSAANRLNWNMYT